MTGTFIIKNRSEFMLLQCMPPDGIHFFPFRKQAHPRDIFKWSLFCIVFIPCLALGFSLLSEKVNGLLLFASILMLSWIVVWTVFHYLGSSVSKLFKPWVRNGLLLDDEYLYAFNGLSFQGIPISIIDGSTSEVITKREILMGLKRYYYLTLYFKDGKTLVYKFDGVLQEYLDGVFDPAFRGKKDASFAGVPAKSTIGISRMLEQGSITKG